MTTLKQIAANRENAKRSTGPRTAEGKRRASQNAITHGLHSHDFLTDIESEDDYHVFHDQLIHDYQPETATDYILIEQYLQAYFLKRRFLQKMPDFHNAETRHFSNETILSYPVLMKMINQADRMLHRALELLERFKTERKKEAAKRQQAETKPKPTKDTPEIGFVLSPFETLDPQNPYPTPPHPNPELVKR